MTKLGDKFLLALRTQGYDFHVTVEDLVITGARDRERYHVPAVLLHDDGLELLLTAAIVSFASQEGPRRFKLATVLGRDADPGRN